MEYLNRRGSTILIEEAETHMYSGYVSNIARTLTEIPQKDIRLSITTHNIDFVESFVTDPVQKSYSDHLKKEFKLIQLPSSTVKEYGYTEAMERTDKHISISMGYNAWKDRYMRG